MRTQQRCLFLPILHVYLFNSFIYSCCLCLVENCCVCRRTLEEAFSHSSVINRPSRSLLFSNGFFIGLAVKHLHHSVTEPFAALPPPQKWLLSSLNELRLVTGGLILVVKKELGFILMIYLQSCFVCVCVFFFYLFRGKV